MTMNKRVSREHAGRLLDFGGRRDASALSRQLIDSQLDGAVAAHNLLLDRGVAYVADEVGTGKTLVAAGVLALLRHDDPSMRALARTSDSVICGCERWAVSQRDHCARLDGFRMCSERGRRNLTATSSAVSAVSNWVIAEEPLRTERPTWSRGVARWQPVAAPR